jgi:Na+/melibiose symporter-like transporter
MKLSNKQLFAYGSLGMPIAFVGLPIYLHLPHYYATTHGISLALIGTVLLLVRLFDAFQDPLIGFYSDKTKHSNLKIILWAAPFLTIGFIALFAPPKLSHDWTILWLVGFLLLTYTAFNFVMINYYAASTSLPQYSEKAALISGAREAGMLLGIMFAATLPEILKKYFDEATAFRYFSVSFVPIILIGIIGICYCLKRNRILQKHGDHSVTLGSMKNLKPLAPLYLLFFMNSMPASITSTLFLFFVEDYLKTPDQAGYLLACFFLSSAVSVPIWVYLSHKIGNWKSLRIGLVLSISSFICTIFLGAGDVFWFYLICAASGAAVGGDLTLLPTIFTKAIAENDNMSASAFSIWHFLAKINLALAAGLLFRGLAYFNYQPKVTEGATILLIFYAVIPCFIKLLALVLACNKKVINAKL